MKEKKLSINQRIKIGLLSGFIFSTVMAGFDYLEDESFSIFKYILNFSIFGLVMAFIITSKKSKK